MKEIRLLKADEIDVRVQKVIDGNYLGAILLLYKNARCDMAILDETFSMTGWQRHHSFKDENNYCTVSIWDDDKKMWIDKEDVGVESYSDKKKGEASDAFKRACFNVGIGRELYTAPFIYVSIKQDEIARKNDKVQLKSSVVFSVGSIEYDENRQIKHLKIVDQNGNVRFSHSKQYKSIGQTSLSDQNKTKRELTLEMLDDKKLLNNGKTMMDSLLEWAYQKRSIAGNAEQFNAAELLSSRYVISSEVAQKFAALFRSYVQAKLNESTELL